MLLIKNSGNKGNGTGFICKTNIFGEHGSTILVTCYHVIICGLSEEKFKDVVCISDSMKTDIEDNAKKFKIIVNGNYIELKSILISGSCKVSSAIKVCLYNCLVYIFCILINSVMVFRVYFV